MNKYAKAIAIVGFTALVGEAMAQAPSFSLPPLPNAPSAPMPAEPSAIPATTSQTASTSTNSTVVSPNTDTANSAEVAAPVPNESADKTAVNNAPATSSVDTSAAAPDAANGADANNMAAATDAPPANQALPNLPMPTAATTDTPSLQMAAPEVPQIAKEEAPASEPVKPVSTKTWLTKLAPSSQVPELGYNYRRVLLPEVIYRNAYNRDNRHLPTRITKDDYAELFFMSVAKNDINAARALLNAGVPVNATNANGETALALAKRYGAVDTARLLMARGAQ